MSVTPLDGFVLNGSEYEMRDKLAQARIDNLVAQNNPTDGNTELLDIRVGADGHTYDSAGQAIRENFSKTKLNIDSLKSAINLDLLSVLDWDYGVYLTDTGKDANQSTYASSRFFEIFDKEKIIHNISQFTDALGNTLNLYVHEYDEDMRWIQRESLKTQDLISFEDTQVKYIRFCIGRYADSGISFTKDDLSYFHVYIQGGIYNRFLSLTKGVIKISVGTFNVGGYSGGNSELIDVPTGDITEYLKYISSLSVDVLFLQEDREFWDIPNQISTKEKMYDYLYQYGGVISKSTNNNGIWGKSIYSNYPLKNGGKYTFNTQGTHPETGKNLWNSFTYYTLHIKDIEVLVLSVHLAAKNNNVAARKSQILEILNFINGHKYVIVAGDFNVWEDEYEDFDDTKYNKANCGIYGELNTFSSQNFHPFDTVITTKNIKILNPLVHNNEFGDHFALTCDLIFAK